MLQRSHHIDPNYAAAFSNTGVAYYKLDDLGKAIKYFEKALKINPRNKKASRYKFRALYEKGEPKKAHRYIAQFNRKWEEDQHDQDTINK